MIKVSNRIWAWLIGIGLILFIWHNPYQPLLSYAFIPWIGLLLMVIVIGIIVRDQWKKLTLGSKWIWIPLAVIAGSMVISRIINWPGINVFIAYVAVALLLFMLYPVSRLLGKDIFTPFIFAVVVEAVSNVVWAATHGWVVNGGLLSPTNYDIATGLLVFGTLVSAQKHWWWLMAVAIVGLVFSGSTEAVFAVGVLAIAFLATKRWKLFALPTATLIVVLAIIVPLGIARTLYQRPIDVVSDKPTVFSESEQMSFNRLEGYKVALSTIEPFGHGYNINHFYYDIPHNIPLIILYQVGPLAVLAWLWVSFRSLKRKEWFYAWIGLLALSVFDHYIWTQAAPWWWILVGVSNNGRVSLLPQASS